MRQGSNHVGWIGPVLGVGMLLSTLAAPAAAQTLEALPSEVSMSSVAATPGAETLPVPSQPTRPKWAWPIRASFLKYPKAAIAGRVTGMVELKCTVSGEKGHVKCIVVSETPEGYDFGSEAVKGIEKNMRAAPGVPVGTVMTTPPMQFSPPG